MKKTLIAMAVLGAASGFAMAASNVTLYGLIETGVAYSNAAGKVTVNGKLQEASGRVQMTSGFDSGSRFGIAGVEELGNGYNVGFILEQGFDSDDGENAEDSQQFSREAFMYITGGFGKVGFGRTGGLAFAQSNNIRSGWVFGTGYGAAAWNSIDFVAKRMNNVVSYATPKFSGFTLHAMYSNSGTGNTASDDNKWSLNGHYYGLGAMYNANNIKSSLIFEVGQNKDLVAPKNRNAKYGINYGLEWNLGSITPMFGYQYTWQDGGLKLHQFGLSAAAPLAGGTAKIGTRYTFGKSDAKDCETTYGTDKANAWFIGAAYEYPFSKRTMLKSYAGYTKGGKLFKKDNAFYQAKSWDDAIKFNGYQIFAGLQHKF